MVVHYLAEAERTFLVLQVAHPVRERVPGLGLGAPDVPEPCPFLQDDSIEY